MNERERTLYTSLRNIELEIRDFQDEMALSMASKRLNKQQKEKVTLRCREYIDALEARKTPILEELGEIKRIKRRILEEVFKANAKRKGIIVVDYKADVWLFWTYPQGIPFVEPQSSVYVYRGG